MSWDAMSPRQLQASVCTISWKASSICSIPRKSTTRSMRSSTSAKRTGTMAKPPLHRIQSAPRIIVSGTGLGGTAEKTIHVIEELGGAVVCYEGCSGISSRRRLIDEDRSRDPYLRIAEKYIEVPCAVVSPNTRRLEQVAETVREWNADGIVSITLHSCNPFAIETENIRRVCNQMGIPLLHIETDFTPGDEAQIRTRLGAFLEMIRAEKEAAYE